MKASMCTPSKIAVRHSMLACFVMCAGKLSVLMTSSPVVTGQKQRGLLGGHEGCVINSSSSHVMISPANSFRQ